MHFLCLFLVFCSALFASKPDYMIIGAMRSGTTALNSLLKQHPLIVRQNGERHFFDSEEAEKGKKFYFKSLPEKPTPDHLVGDKTPYYLFHPLVPQRVFEMCPDVKILVVLRNPVDRAYSHYWFTKALGHETLTFEEALEAEYRRLKGESEKFFEHPLYQSLNHKYLSYATRGRYVEQLERWYAYFPKEQILVIDAQDLRTNPQETMNQVFTFLGLPEHPIQDTTSALKRTYPPMKEKTRQKLIKYFEPYNEKLEALLGRKFNWN